jgi:lipoyl(octanoyl) transferase
VAPDSDRPIDQECVEAYLFSGRPARFLIFRRTPERGRIWVPISGKVDPGDANFEAALRRELAEETGFTAPERVFSLDWEFLFEGPTGGRWRLHAYGVELSHESSPTLSSEHEAYEWVEAAEAIQRLHYEDNQEAVRRVLVGLGERPPPVAGSQNV